MRLVISTHSGLYATNSNGVCEKWSAGYYYGLVKPEPDRLLAFRRISPYHKDSRTAAELYNLDGERLFYDEHPALAEVRDAHQAAIDAGGSIFITDSCNDVVWCFDNDGTVSNIRHEHERLIAPNSVFTRGDGVYVVYHNRGEHLAALADSEKATATFMPHYGVHNVIVSDKAIIYNASEAGETIQWDGESEHYESVGVPLPGKWHTKGLTRAGEWLLAGYSEREVTLKQRFTSESGIMRIDEERWQVGEPIPLSWHNQPIGNINEILILCPIQGLT